MSILSTLPWYLTPTECLNTITCFFLGENQCVAKGSFVKNVNFSNFNNVRLFSSVQVRAQKVFLSSFSSLVSVPSDDDNSSIFLPVGFGVFFGLIYKLAKNCQVHKQNLAAKQQSCITWRIILHCTEYWQNWQMVSKEEDQPPFCNKPINTDGKRD